MNKTHSLELSSSIIQLLLVSEKSNTNTNTNTNININMLRLRGLRGKSFQQKTTRNGNNDTCAKAKIIHDHDNNEYDNGNDDEYEYGEEFKSSGKPTTKLLLRVQTFSQTLSTHKKMQRRRRQINCIKSCSPAPTCFITERKRRGIVAVLFYAAAFFSFSLFMCHYKSGFHDPQLQQKHQGQGLQEVQLLQQESHENKMIKKNNLVQEEGQPIPIVHIVNTRFMQNQPNLTTLGRARFHLFQTFCLPSMVQQTNQNFYWIIKIDPELDTHIQRALIGLVEEHSAIHKNIYVVASNRNYLIGHLRGSFRGGIESHDIIQHIHNNTVYTGDIDSLYNVAKESIISNSDTSSSSDQQIVLETRLDADDGLNKYFVEYIQKDAVENIFFTSRTVEVRDKKEEYKARFYNYYYDRNDIHVPSKTKWYYWCIEKHVKWYPGGNTQLGRISGEKRLDFCITPGLTVGFNVGTSLEEVPMYSHHQLHKNLHAKRSKPNGVLVEEGNGRAPHGEDEVVVLGNANQALKGTQSRMLNDCGAEKCIGFVRQFIGAVRSRTSTSAGMEDTKFLSRFEMDEDLNEWIWAKLRTEFNVSLDALIEMQTYLKSNSKEIARENLEGQCTDGHSCKRESREKLRRLIRS